MSDNDNLHKAKVVKNDEFYTQYETIEKEMNKYINFDKNIFRDKVILLSCDDPELSNFTKYFIDNFKSLGIKRLISSSYSSEVKKLTLFDVIEPNFDRSKLHSQGKILDVDKQNIDNNLKFRYLDGDGDFRSKEITALRDIADIVITNPPFSLVDEFEQWLLEGKKKYIYLGPLNAITYKVFLEQMKQNKLYASNLLSGETFTTCSKYNKEKTQSKKFGNILWFSNIDHGDNYINIEYHTMDYNLENNNRLKNKLEKEYGIDYYPQLENYNAIEVPIVDAIPIDYEGIMAVPITYISYHNPKLFRVLGQTGSTDKNIDDIRTDFSKQHGGFINGKSLYRRLLIQKIQK